MAAEGKRVVAIAIDESDFAEQAYQWYLTNVRMPNDNLILIHVPEMYDLTMARLVKDHGQVPVYDSLIDH